MNYQQFIQQFPNCYCIEGGTAILEIDDYSKINTESCCGFHSILFVDRGTLTIEIGRRRVFMSPNSYADILEDVEFRYIEATPDIHAYVVLFTDAYMSGLMKDNPPFPLRYVIENKKNPVRQVTIEEGKLFSLRFRSICRQFVDEKHNFKTEMIKCAVWMLLMDIANCYLSKVGDSNKVTGEGRKHEILMQFMTLLSQHAKEEHSVGFYASALCVTPQYLARIVKQLSGHTVLQWIQKTLLGEINKLLQNTKLSIQQISDDFGFPDQATFSKFYKRGMGMPPTEYRARNMI